MGQMQRRSIALSPGEVRGSRQSPLAILMLRAGAMLDGHGRTAVQHQIDRTSGFSAALPHIEPPLPRQE